MNKFKKIILENGIPLYLCVDPTMKKTFVSYSVKYGHSGIWFDFKNDGKDRHVLPGHAHYLEHLLGEHCKYGNMYENFTRRFQNNNAYTGMNFTTYVLNGIYEVDKSTQELIHAIEEPVFDDKDVEASRRAIANEAAGTFDNHGLLLCDMVEKNLFSGIDLYDQTLSPIGNRETTNQITTQSLYDCYDAFYTDDRKFIIIAGDVEEENIVDFLNNVFASIKPHKSKLILPEQDLSGMRKTNDILHRDIDVPITALGVKIKKPEGISNKQFYYCMGVFEQYLLDSKEYSGLEKDGHIDSFDSVFANLVGDYIAFIQSFTTKKKKACCERLLELLNKRQITKEEYELVQKCIIASELREVEDKYEYLTNFPDSMNITEEYCDADFYRSIDYDTFMDTLSAFDFSDYSIGEVRQLRRRK